MIIHFNLKLQVMLINTMTGIGKESKFTTTRGRKRPVREVSVDEVDLPDSLIKDIFDDEEIHMAGTNLLHIRDEDLDEYDESSDGDNSTTFNYSLKDFGLGSSSSGASEEGSTTSGRGGTSAAQGKRRYQRSSEGQGQSCRDLEDISNGGNGSEASEKSGQDGGYESSKRKQVLSARERNLRRLESNERERQRMCQLVELIQFPVVSFQFFHLFHRHAQFK